MALRGVSSWAVVEQMSPDAELFTPECFAILGAAKRHFCQVRDGGKRIERYETCVCFGCG